MRHTPHPDALRARLQCGAQREACKGAWGKERVEFYYQVVLEVGMQVNKIKFKELKPQQILISLTIRETGKLEYQILKKMQNLFMRKTINKLEI